MIRVEDVKLRLVGAAVDQILKWCSETYLRLRTESSSLLFVLATCEKRGLNRQPFKFPQRASTMIQYASKWKQLLIYAIRTSLTDEKQREELYGIRFTEEQLLIIQELIGLVDGLTLEDISANPIFEFCDQEITAAGENGSEETKQIDNNDSEEERDEDEEEDDNGDNHSKSKSAMEAAAD